MAGVDADPPEGGRGVPRAAVPHNPPPPRHAAAGRKRRAVFGVVHGSTPADLKRAYRDKSYSRALAAGDRVIVPSRYAADQLAARHQVPREKLAVISRRIDGTRFDPPAISPER